MTKQNCPKCGSSVESNDRFCMNCGHSFSSKISYEKGTQTRAYQESMQARNIEYLIGLIVFAFIIFLFFMFLVP